MKKNLSNNLIKNNKEFLLAIIFLSFVAFFVLDTVRWIENPIFATVISGTLVFLLQKIISDMVLDPYLNYKKVVGKIDNKLKLYANIIYSNCPTEERATEVISEIRKLSCDLESSYKMMTVKIGPSKKEIAKASKNLIFLSNSTGIKNNAFIDNNLDMLIKAENEIRALLKIEKYD